MDISSISDDILMDWIRSTIQFSRSDLSGPLYLARLSDSDKVDSITAYLEARVAAHSAQSTALRAGSNAEADALDADVAICNAILNP